MTTLLRFSVQVSIEPANKGFFLKALHLKDFSIYVEAADISALTPMLQPAFDLYFYLYRDFQVASAFLVLENGQAPDKIQTGNVYDVVIVPRAKTAPLLVPV